MLAIVECVAKDGALVGSVATAAVLGNCGKARLVEGVVREAGGAVPADRLCTVAHDLGCERAHPVAADVVRESHRVGIYWAVRDTA